MMVKIRSARRKAGRRIWRTRNYKSSFLITIILIIPHEEIKKGTILVR
jgi:hypothetical protein